MNKIIIFRISGKPRIGLRLVYNFTMTGNESRVPPRTNLSSTDRTLVTIEPDYVVVRLHAGQATLCTELAGVSLDVVSQGSKQLSLEIRTRGGRITSSIPLSSAGADALAEGLSIAVDTEGEPHHE